MVEALPSVTCHLPICLPTSSISKPAPDTAFSDSNLLWLEHETHTMLLKQLRVVHSVAKFSASYMLSTCWALGLNRTVSVNYMTWLREVLAG